VIPSQMSRRLAELVPACKASFFDDEGHYSLPITKRYEIVRSLLG
jgi:hypothetical protein